MSDEMDEVPAAAVVRHPAAQWRPDRERMRRRLARETPAPEEVVNETDDDVAAGDDEPGDSPHYP